MPFDKGTAIAGSSAQLALYATIFIIAFVIYKFLKSESAALDPGATLAP
ncbi:MAG: sortase B protein-sorting domain-containing protein [Candidatus Dormibacteraceae bacterium]